MFMLLNVSIPADHKKMKIVNICFPELKKRIICFLGFKNENDQLLKRNKKEIIPKEEGNYKGYFYDKKDKL